MFNHSFPACAFLLLFLKVEITSRTRIPLFMPGSVHSGSAVWLYGVDIEAFYVSHYG